MRYSLLFLLLGALPALAADKPAKTPEPALPPLTESVTVSVTSVDIVVTDKKGNRVSGLKKEDFQIFEDGVPQPVTNFYAVAGGKTTLDDGTVVSVLGEEGEKAAEIPPTLKLRFLLYIDNLMLEPLHRNRVFRSIRDFLEKEIQAGAEGMIVTNNRTVKVRQNFTTDRGLLLGVLDDIEHESGGATSFTVERDDAITRINDATSVTDATDIATQTSRSLDDDVKYAVDGLKMTLNSLAGLEGRKVLVYVSDGLPQSVGGELFDLVQRKFQQSPAMMQALEFDRSASYATIIQAANANGVTLYTIDAAGLKIAEGVSAEYGTRTTQVSTFVSQQNYQEPLRTLAQETGGIAAINTNDPTHELSEIAKDFSDFYSLGYRSARGASDRPHRLEVRVSKPGLTARYRAGFTEKTVETQTAEAVTAALFYARSDNALKYAVAVGDSKPYDKQNYLVPVRISVPINSVTLVPDGDNYRGRLYVYFVVLDSTGNQSDLQIRPVELKIPLKKLDEAKRHDFSYDVQLIMIPGGQKLSTAVRDAVSGSVSYLQKSIFISVLPGAESKGKS